MLEVCHLCDLGFTGIPFTYGNKRDGRANVQARLDRAVATNQWRNLFAFSKVNHIVSPTSDHVMLLLVVVPEDHTHRAKTRQYEIMWEQDSTHPETVKTSRTLVGSIGNLEQI